MWESIFNLIRLHVIVLIVLKAVAQETRAKTSTHIDCMRKDRGSERHRQNFEILNIPLYEKLFDMVTMKHPSNALDK